uniref:Uncharacterized protein n=1 Tax=Arundo donax TaxID=35708 RepID=A0A0A9EIF1_ARUDO
MLGLLCTASFNIFQSFSCPSTSTTLALKVSIALRSNS